MTQKDINIVGVFKDAINEENLKKPLKEQFEKEFDISNFDIETLKAIMISFISCYIDVLQKEKESE